MLMESRSHTSIHQSSRATSSKFPISSTRSLTLNQLSLKPLMSKLQLLMLHQPIMHQKLTATHQLTNQLTATHRLQLLTPLQATTLQLPMPSTPTLGNFINDDQQLSKQYLFSFVQM